MSDNGAEGAAYEAYPIVQSTMLGHLEKYYNNALENIGRGDSFVWYGPRWAQAATAPHRLFKAFTTEGGVRVPFLAKFPTGMHVHTDGESWQRGILPTRETATISSTFATIMDLTPTILAMAGVPHPAPLYRDREVVPMRGRDMLPYLAGRERTVHPADFIHGWETCGRAAVRCGDWKIVFIPKPKGPERWQLYNLAQDPGEVCDLAGEDPTRLQRMIRMWDQYVLETGVIPLAPALGNWIAAMEEQMPEDASVLRSRRWGVRAGTCADGVAGGWNMSIGKMGREMTRRRLGGRCPGLRGRSGRFERDEEGMRVRIDLVVTIARNEIRISWKMQTNLLPHSPENEVGEKKKPIPR
jgi:arylsulfatase